MASSRLTKLVFAAGLAVWIVNAFISWVSGAPLGHDEAQYALAAKDALAGHEPRWWYVSSGMIAVAMPGVLAGGSELALRFVPFVLGIGFVLSAWFVTRRAFGAATAAWVVAVLAGTRSLVKQSSELLSDMPAATCLLAATAVIVDELDRDDGPRWRVMLAAPLLAGALYLRYASCVPIALLGVAWLGFGWRAIARRPAPVIATAALFGLLFVPHAWSAMELTGSPFGILLDSGGVPGHAYPGEGLVTYATQNPFVYYGLLAPPLLIAGVIVALLRRDRRALFVWSVAIASIVVIGLVSHAQARYIFFGTTLLVTVGVDAIARWIESRPSTLQKIGVAIAGASIAIAWAFVALGQARHATGRIERSHDTLAAIHAIRNDRDATASRCVVDAESYTQLEWYTGCVARDFASYDPIARGERLYIVRDKRTGFAPLPARPEVRHTTLLAVPGNLEVVRADRCVDATCR